jgi:hypothetical protein
MRNMFSKATLFAALGALCATTAFAQAPGSAPPTGSVAVANPTYTAILMEVDVNRPAAEVWKRVGKFCDIGEWLQFPCTITYGKDGEVGAVRSIGREVLVGKTDLSYTYTQPVTEGRPYILYHGTLEAKPVTATTSKLYYTLMWDNSTLADDAARERDKAQRRQVFEGALKNMKTLAEGGTLPPRAPRGGGPGGAGPQGGPGSVSAPGAGQPK